MENATKALLIAAGVLIGVIILSLGVYLFSNLGSYVTNTQKQIEENALNKFNTQFLKYINTNDGQNTQFELTFQDVITAASLAYDNNQQYNLTLADANENTYYVRVTAKISDSGSNRTVNLEDNVLTKSADWLKENHDKKYICKTSDVKISPITKRVYEINFQEKQ